MSSSAITDFARSGVWNYKDIIAPAAVAVPLAVEGAIFVKNVCQNPQIIKEEALAAKDWVNRSFTAQPSEDKHKEIRRIAKNALILVCCLALMAVAIYGAVVLLPTALAITTALSAIFLIGKLFLNAEKYKNQIVDKFTDMFTARKGEDPVEAKKRIAKNVLKTLAVMVVVGTLLAVGIHYILIPMLTQGFTWHFSLPFQTKGVVFAEYASIGVLNGGIAYHKWKKGDKIGALYHLFLGVLSFVFPAFYWNTEMRLHHSFYGLLLMTTPYRPLRFLGGMVCFDSLLYMLASARGYTSVSDGLSTFHEYDFMNNVVDNLSLYAGGYAGALMLHNINDYLAEKIRSKHKDKSITHVRV